MWSIDSPFLHKLLLLSFLLREPKTRNIIILSGRHIQQWMCDRDKISCFSSPNFCMLLQIYDTRRDQLFKIFYKISERWFIIVIKREIYMCLMELLAICDSSRLASRIIKCHKLPLTICMIFILVGRISSSKLGISYLHMMHASNMDWCFENLGHIPYDLLFFQHASFSKLV